MSVFKVECRCGPQYRTIEADAIIGDYAIHKTIRNGWANGPGYTVTEVKSGLAVWYVREIDQAFAIANWLVDNTQIGLRGADAWKADASARAKVDLINDLTAIAPRYWGEE